MVWLWHCVSRIKIVNEFKYCSREITADAIFHQRQFGLRIVLLFGFRMTCAKSRVLMFEGFVPALNTNVMQ